MPWIGAVICVAFVAFLLDRFQSNFITSSIINFSMVVSGSASIAYLLDTHGGNALHVFSLTNFIKNMVLYGFTFFANGVVLQRGVKVFLLILAACQAFCWLLSIPMYRYGKRVRAFVSRRFAFLIIFCLLTLVILRSPAIRASPKSREYVSKCFFFWVAIVSVEYLNPSEKSGNWKLWWKDWLNTFCTHIQKTPFLYIHDTDKLKIYSHAVDWESPECLNLHNRLAE